MPDKIIDTTVAMKLTGEMRVRVVGRGFKQKQGKQFKEDDISALVISLITIRIVLVLVCMCDWYTHLIDMEGAFLNTTFDNGEIIFVRVPEPF